MATAQGDIMIGGVNVKNMANRFSADFSTNKQPMAIHDPKKNIFNKSTHPQVVAIFTYKQFQQDELNLTVGDIIEVLEEIEDGWSRGRNIKTGDIGMFPTNFVEPRSTPTTTNPPVLRENHAEPEATKRAPSVVGMPLPTQAPVITVKPKEPAKHEEPKKSSHVDDVKTKEMARVKFVYEPQHPDELKLGEIGALIEIVRKNCGDPGWFEGELNGKVGLFPDNFVELVQVPAGSTSGSPKTSIKSDNRVAAKAPILAPTGAVAVPPAVPAKPKPKISDPASTQNAAPSLPSSKPVLSSNFSDNRNKLAGMRMLAPGDPAPSLSKSTIVTGSSEASSDIPNRPVSTYEITEDQPTQLSHVTKDRPRGPGKRPTSMMVLKKKGSTENLLDSSILPLGVTGMATSNPSIFSEEKTPEVVTTSPSKFVAMKPVKEETKDLLDFKQDYKPIFPSTPSVPKAEEPLKVRSIVFQISSDSTKVSPVPLGESDTVSRKEYNDVLTRLAAVEARLAALESLR